MELDRQNRSCITTASGPVWFSQYIYKKKSIIKKKDWTSFDRQKSKGKWASRIRKKKAKQPEEAKKKKISHAVEADRVVTRVPRQEYAICNVIVREIPAIAERKGELLCVCRRRREQKQRTRLKVLKYYGGSVR